MQRFSKFIDSRRADFWKAFYTSPELLSLFAYLNQIMAAKLGGYELLNTYDIASVGEHNPGVTKVWESADLVYSADTGIANTYRYIYGVDDAWITVEGLSDAHVDPSEYYLAGIDYTYSNGTIRSKCKLDNIKFVTKGQYANTKLADYMGTAFGYAREDSFKYRDNMEVMLKLFYEGPTIDNLVSAIHAVINSPVAKYDNEVVLSTADGEILTNKYKYDLGGADVSVQVGDTVNKGEPLARAVEIYTDKTSPGWWKDRIPSMFGKYSPDTPLTYSLVNVLMDTFLKLFVAHVRINLSYVDNTSIHFFEDLWNLVLDGSSVRTDYLISAYRLDTDPFVPYVLDGANTLRIHGFCVWGEQDINSEGWLYAPDVVKPAIFADDVVDPYWKIDSHRWHILDANSQVKEFWSATDVVPPYFEPTHDYWHIVTHTAEEGTDLPITRIPAQVSSLTNSEFSPFDGFFLLAIDPENKESDSDRNISSVTDSIDALQTSSLITNNVPASTIIGHATSNGVVNKIYGDMNIGHAELSLWTINTPLTLGAAGIVCHKSDTGTAYSDATFVGSVPKNATIVAGTNIPEGTSISIYYKLNSGDWIVLPEEGLVSGATDYLYFKVVLTASAVSYPTFKGLDITLRL